MSAGVKCAIIPRHNKTQIQKPNFTKTNLLKYLASTLLIYVKVQFYLASKFGFIRICQVYYLLLFALRMGDSNPLNP